MAIFHSLPPAQFICFSRVEPTLESQLRNAETPAIEFLEEAPQYENFRRNYPFAVGPTGAPRIGTARTGEDPYRLSERLHNTDDRLEANVPESLADTPANRYDASVQYLVEEEKPVMTAHCDLSKRPTVLIVEDETITAHHLRQALTRLGYQVLGVAADGRTALSLIEQVCPSLILADIGLDGDLDGIEVATRALHQWNIPTVFLTAYSDPETMRRTKATEPYGYLVKPFAEQDLHATVEIALQRRDLAASRERQVKATAHVLGRTQEELSEMSARLLSAQEQERERIARDLHDDVGQRVALLHMDLERMWGKIPPVVQDTAGAEFRAVLGRVAELSKDLRNLSHDLHPPILDDLGLEIALRELCETFQERHATPVRFSARNVPAEIPPATAIALYRIVQESLQNIAKHADADAVHVALIGGTETIELSVRDNGSGFDPGTQKSASGLGLVSMTQRAKLAGGTLEIESHLNTGTRIRVSVPKAGQKMQDGIKKTSPKTAQR